MEDGSERDWACLPDLVLDSILNRLINLVDFFAFNSVCISWRSVSKSLAGKSGYITSRPPLLSFCVPSSTKPSTCTLHPLTDDANACYVSKLPPSAIKNQCIGYSYGYLILNDYFKPRLLFLADVFTGKEIQLPELPPKFHEVYYGILTAPPSSPDCLLLLFDSRAYLWCRLGDVKWSHQRHGFSFIDMFRISSILVFKGQIYAVNCRCELFTIDLLPHPKLKQLELEGFDFNKWWMNPLWFKFEGPELVECDGELPVLLILEQWGHVSYTDIEIYRLDFSRLALLKVNSLGDRSLFVDYVGRRPMVCINPATWGGRKNCIYWAGTECDILYECSMDGMLIDKIPSALSDSSKRPFGKSGIWVFPSLLY